MRQVNRGLRAAAWPLAVLGMVSLSACGGGGGLFGPEDRKVLSLSEVSNSCDIAPGESCQGVGLVVRNDQQDRPGWTATPSNGLTIVQSADYQKIADNTWRMSFAVTPDLPAGTYTGTITLSPLNLFSIKYNDLPASLSYKVTVGAPQGTLSALAPLAGASDWEGSNGNAAHTGYVPLTFDAARFTRRWSWQHTAQEVGEHMSPVVAANGLVYFSLGKSVEDKDNKNHYLGINTLTALSEQDASVRWTLPQTMTGGLGTPAVSGNRLVLTDGKYLHAFDADNGVKLAQAAYPITTGVLAAGNAQMAPTMFDGNVYMGGYNDVVSASASTAQAAWSVSLGLPLLGNVDDWTPAVNASSVVTNTAGTLSAYQRGSGERQFSVAVPGLVVGGIDKSGLHQAPVLVDEQTVLLLNQRRIAGKWTDNSLSVVDLGARAVRWTVPGQFTTQPVVARGVIYVGNQATAALEARSVTDGAVLWSWPLAEGKGSYFGGDVIATNTLLFVAGDKATYAIDLASHKVVWRFGMTGGLSLSRNGVLYIRSAQDGARSTSWLTAINLQ